MHTQTVIVQGRTNEGFEVLYPDLDNGQPLPKKIEISRGR
jgi:hypothetical protein